MRPFNDDFERRLAQSIEEIAEKDADEQKPRFFESIEKQEIYYHAYKARQQKREGQAVTEGMLQRTLRIDVCALIIILLAGLVYRFGFDWRWALLVILVFLIVYLLRVELGKR